MYKAIHPSKTYRLINTGALMLVSTVSKKKEPDLTPIAWVCPQELDPARVLIVCDAAHRAFKNIRETGVFTACIPHISQIKLVEECGSVSGGDTDKFSKFGIKAFKAGKSSCMIPQGVIGYVECRVKKIVNIEGTAVIIGDALYAAADTKAFNGSRLMAEKPAGRAIHHLGGGDFITYSGRVIKK